VTINQGWEVYLRPGEYKVKDPRAILLQKLMRELADSQGRISPLFETALALEEACEESLAPKAIYPNVDFYSGILYREIGIPPDQFTSLFAIARTAGWLAHWREQVSENRIPGVYRLRATRLCL
jgi:citrate synthase